MTIYLRRISLITFLTFFTSLTIAATFPRGCEVSGFGFNQNYLIVNDTDAQSFYLLQNYSKKPIALRRVETKPDTFMSPTLATELDPMAWAAFAGDIEGIHFLCSEKENGNFAQVNCSEVIEICRYPRVKFALSNMGTYWVSTNKSQSQVIQEAIKKGILLRW